MSRSMTTLYVSLQLFFVLCPNTWGAEAEKNTVTVHSITLLEDKTAKIAFAIHIEDAKNAIEINLENLAEPTTIKDSLDVIDKKGATQVTYEIKNKKLKLTLIDGDYLLAYIDPTITITGPEYALKLQQDKTKNTLSGAVSGKVSVTNGTKYAWPQKTEIKFVNKKEETSTIAALTQVCEAGKTTLLRYKKQAIPSQTPKYALNITELKAGKAHPSLIMDMKQAWPQSPLYYQLPGKMTVSVDGTVSNELAEKEFKTTVSNPNLQLNKREDLEVTRSKTDDAFVDLDNVVKKTLRGTFKADYIYEYTTIPGPDIALLIPSNAKPARPNQVLPLTNQVPTLRITHSTTLPDLNLLVDADVALGELNSNLNSIHEALSKRIKIATMSENNYSLQDSISDQTKLLETLTHINNNLNKKRHSSLLDLIIEIKTSITTEKGQLKRIDLKKYFEKTENLVVNYQASSSTNFKDSFKQALNRNASIIKRLNRIDGNAEIISKLFKSIPSQSDYQAALRRLAILGEHDADVTLLRKQRTEQMKLAMRFVQVYNSLVIESADIFPIRIEIIQNTGLANSHSRPSPLSGIRVQRSEQEQ